MTAFSVVFIADIVIVFIIQSRNIIVVRSVQKFSSFHNFVCITIMGIILIVVVVDVTVFIP